MTNRQNTGRRVRLAAIALALAGAAVVPAHAAGEGFGRFLDAARGHCATAPAPACIDRLWPYADGNRDGVLTLAEVQRLEKDAAAWAQTVDRTRKDPERDTTLMVLMVLKQAQLPRAFDGFDSDRDGVLTRDELFADFKFDNRPFARLAADPEAVNWTSFGNRFGPIGVLLASLMRPAPPKSQPRAPAR